MGRSLSSSQELQSDCFFGYEHASCREHVVLLCCFYSRVFWSSSCYCFRMSRGLCGRCVAWTRCFQFPGSGDYFHQLHHAHFDCNYGAMHFPMDKWLGTYAGSKEDVRKIWGKKPHGKKANKTPVHTSSGSPASVS